MRLPDDYDDRSGLTPTVVSAIVAVTLFVAIILAVVLLMNDDHRGNRNHNTAQSQSAQQTPQPTSSVIIYPDTDPDLMYTQSPSVREIVAALPRYNLPIISASVLGFFRILT